MRLDVAHIQFSPLLAGHQGLLLPGEPGVYDDGAGNVELWLGSAYGPLLVRDWHVISASIAGSIDLDGAAAGGEDLNTNIVGSIDLAGAAVGLACIFLDTSAAGTIDLAGAAAGRADLFGDAAAAGSIDLAGAASFRATSDAAAAGSIDLTGAARGVSYGLLAGSLTLAGAAQGETDVQAVAAGSVTLAGAASGGADYVWDGITEFCATPTGFCLGGHLLTGLSTDGEGTWTATTFGDALLGLAVDVSAGVWTCNGVTGTVNSLSPLEVEFDHIDLSGYGCGSDETMFIEEGACAPSGCGVTCNLVQSDTAGDETATNTGADAWSWTVGSCSFLITWTGSTYHLSGEGNEIDATSLDCDPFEIVFDGVDLSCNGEGTISVTFHCEPAASVSVAFSGISDGTCNDGSCAAMNATTTLTYVSSYLWQNSGTYCGNSPLAQLVYGPGYDFSAFPAGTNAVLCVGNNFPFADIMMYSVDFDPVTGVGLFSYYFDFGACVGWPGTVSTTSP